jgi:hypothetical protein
MRKQAKQNAEDTTTAAGSGHLLEVGEILAEAIVRGRARLDQQQESSQLCPPDGEISLDCGGLQSGGAGPGKVAGDPI